MFGTDELFPGSQKRPFIRSERSMKIRQEHRKILRILVRQACGAGQKAMHEHVRNATRRTGMIIVTPATS